MSYQHDQADTLRRLMRERVGTDSKQVDDSEAPAARVFTVASGKGGVGKSCLVANLGPLLARSGLKVLLVDGDVGLANLDILLGLPREHRATFEQVIDGKARIQDAIVGVEPNLWLVSSASGLSEVRNSSAETRERLIEVFQACPWEMDVILVDAGAGIGQNVLSLHNSLFESLIVLTPEPTAFADAYSLIKLLHWNAGIRRFGVVVNLVADGKQGQAMFQKLKDVAARFLDVELEYIGHVQRDEKITQSVMKRKILVDLDGGASSVSCLELLAKRIFAKCQESPIRGQAPTLARLRSDPNGGNMARFWRTLLGEVKT